MTQEVQEWIERIDNGEKPPDFLTHIGTEHYKWPAEYAEEVMLTGVSRRIPKEVGRGLVPGVSRMGFVHEKAEVLVTMNGLSMYDLALELMSDFGPVEADEFDPVALELVNKDGHSLYRLIRLLQRADERKDFNRLQEKYGLQFKEGTFAWAFLTGKQYVMDPEETDVPAEVFDVGAEPVYDEYVD